MEPQPPPRIDLSPEPVLPELLIYVTHSNNNIN
jgi:hypothetical protein